MANDINDGGPAFPLKEPLGCDAIGMTLRDYFAAQALGVMCSSNVNATGTFATPEGRAAVASVCYLMADAMLTARKES